MKEPKKMTEDERITRINELYHKSQAEGLTAAEQAEQKDLRSIFVANVRANLRNQLNNIAIQNEDGSVVELAEKYGKKRTN